MNVRIDSIRINSRVRQDSGDLADLKDSISRYGLHNPVLIDEKNRLVAGYRRLRVCRELGWTDIEAIVIDTKGNELKKLEIELQENVGRSDLTEEDMRIYQERYKELSKPLKKGFNLWLWLKGIFRRMTAFLRKERG